jgi:hypothetical protein
MLDIYSFHFFIFADKKLYAAASEGAAACSSAVPIRSDVERLISPSSSAASSNNGNPLTLNDDGSPPRRPEGEEDRSGEGSSFEGGGGASFDMGFAVVVSD